MNKAKTITKKPIVLTGRYLVLQNIYNEKGITSYEFYVAVQNYIKYVLGKHMFGIPFDEGNTHDCYVLMVQKVNANYDANKGALGGFIYSIIRNYCTKEIYKRKYKKKPTSLEGDIEYNEDCFESSETHCNQIHTLRQIECMKIPEELIPIITRADGNIVETTKMSEDVKCLLRLILWKTYAN